MPLQQEDILVRLDRTIASWNDEVTQAQSDLTRQIAETKDQLSTLARVLASRVKNGSALSEALQDVTRLKAELRQYEAELEPVGPLAPVSPAERIVPSERERMAAEAVEDARRETLMLRESLRERDETLRVATNSAAILGGALDGLRQEFEAFRERAAEAGETGAFLRVELSALRRAVEQALAARSTGGTGSADADSSGAGLEAELENTRREREAIRAEAAGIHRERDALASEMDAMQLRIGEAEALIRGSRAELEEVLRSTREQTEALDMARVEIAELQTARELAARGERARADENEELRHKLDDVVLALGESQKMVEAANQRVEQARAKQADAESRTDASPRALTERGATGTAPDPAADAAALPPDEELNRARAGHEAASQALESLQQQHESLAAELDRVRQEASAIWELRESLADERAAVATAQESLDRVEAERDAAHLTLESSRQQHEASVAELAQLRQERSEGGELRETLAHVQAERDVAMLALQTLQHRIEEIEIESAQAVDERIEELAALREQNELLQAALTENREGPRDELRDALDKTERLRRDIPRHLPSVLLDDFEPPPDDDAGRIVHASFDAQGRTRSMGEILVNAGIITPGQLRSALDEQRASGTRRLGTILVERGLAREDAVARVLAAQTQAPFVQLADVPVDPAALAAFGGELARRTMCFPVSLGEGTITVAVPNPSDVFTIEEIELGCGLKVEPVVATLADITSAIVRHFGVD